MYKKTLGSLLLAGLALIAILMGIEMRRTNFAEDGCYAMNAPSEPTVCE